MLNLKRILVPVDLSEGADQAIAWAIRLAKEEGHAAIILFHSLAPIPGPLGPETLAYSFETFQNEKRSIRRKLKALAAKVPLPIATACMLGDGPVATEIVRVCKDCSVDLVVLTTHGRRGLSHFVNGSVSEETVRLAPCPVLVLHMNNADQWAAVKAS